MTIIWCMVPEIWSAMGRIVILDQFLPFYPINNPKDQNFDKMKTKTKTPGDIIILHKCAKNRDHMLYCSCDMARDGCNFFHFGLFFLPFYPPNDPKNQNIKKLNKLLDIIILHMCTKNYDHLMYSSWEMVRYRQMDIRTDGKSDITRWVPHLQIDFFPAFLAFSARVTIMFFL